MSETISYLNQLLIQGILVNLDQFPPITGITQFQTKCGRVVFLKHENTSPRTPYWRSYEVILDGNNLCYTKNYSEALAVVKQVVEQIYPLEV